MPNVLELLNLLALLSIGLMSITVPTFAISISFLGRESKRVLLELENRRKELSKKMEELAKLVASGAGVDALKKEIAQYDEDIEKLNGRLGSLSVNGAFLYPFVCFTVALMVSAYGLYIAPDEVGPSYYYVALGAVALGVYFISRTVFAINQAAINPESLSVLRVSFQSSSKAEKFNTRRDDTFVPVQLLVHNVGQEMAEKLLVHIYFPPEFQLQELATAAGVVRVWTGYQQSTAQPVAYKGYSTIVIESDQLHADVVIPFDIGLKMPFNAGTYHIPVRVWERRLGKTEQELVFEIS